MSASTTDRQAVTSTTLLNQVIAIRGSVKNDTRELLTKHHQLLQKGDLLKGQSRTYVPNDDDDFVYPSEHQNVQVKATQVLGNITKDLTRLFDLTAAMDWTNQHARADVVLWSGDEPVTLLNDVPVSYLMFLEKELVNLETVIRRLPVLDPNETWTFDASQDVYRSNPVQTVKSKKVKRNHMLAPATDKHPAQVEVYTEDEPVGKWTTVKFSGAVPQSKVNKMLARVTNLAEAVKFAREKANLEGIMDPKPGRAVLSYVFDVED